MPIYEYRCEACQHELEALQKISDEPLVNCPKCNAPALRKQVSAAGFRLKGGGWYETDFKSGSKKNVVGDSGAGDSSKTGGESGKTEIGKSDSSSGGSSNTETAGAKPAADNKSATSN
jgi:putative FmdB family regulatory protein